ncbi:hypothetical protein [Streptomyces fradiae]|uniref:hypothetical protein n=1 Tax=Streptomyces fradiae TaxID=1906 RepID=UPI0033D1EBC4
MPWPTAHMDTLGHLLAGAGDDGGQALLTMVTSRPRQGFDRSAGNTLVAPWLSRAEADHTAQPFLTAALKGMDPVLPPAGQGRTHLATIGRRSLHVAGL